MAELKLSPSFLAEEVYTALAGGEVEVDLVNVLKFSVESLEDTNDVFISFYKGGRSQNVIIPAGETRSYENPTGYKFNQKIYIHGAANSAEVLIQTISATS